MDAFSFISTILVLFSLLHHAAGYEINKLTKGCNIFQGKWVYDPSYPIYNRTSCPLIERAFDCVKNGRKDGNYLKFRWKPIACTIPRFNGKSFLRRFRGKKIMFVGDSISLNQWQSLICMIHSAVPRARYTKKRTTSGLSIVTFPRYNTSLMLSRNGLLVDVVSDQKTGRVVKLKSISSGSMWKGIDVLIFNTWHWWLHTGRKQKWDIIQDGGKRYKDMDRLLAYQKALTTWAKWVDINIDPKKTKVFFQGISPDHLDAKEWGEKDARNCRGQTLPIYGSNYPGGRHPAEDVAKNVLSKMSKPVHLLDITKLSQLRIDGHPSVYGSGGHSGTDCSHWCLPGVPDTWNELLFAALIRM